MAVLSKYHGLICITNNANSWQSVQRLNVLLGYSFLMSAMKFHSPRRSATYVWDLHQNCFWWKQSITEQKGWRYPRRFLNLIIITFVWNESRRIILYYVGLQYDSICDLSELAILVRNVWMLDKFVNSLISALVIGYSVFTDTHLDCYNKQCGFLDSQTLILIERFWNRTLHSIDLLQLQAHCSFILKNLSERFANTGH